MQSNQLILGIESSCDETSFAVITLDGDILYEKTFSQIDIHKEFGGVVPNLASQEHLIKIKILGENLINNIDIKEIVCVCPTAGPGLIGSLLVGLMYGKGLAQKLNIPLIGINHLEGHIMSVQIEQKVDYPFLLLLVSGGHSEIIIAHEFGRYEQLGHTLDDAAGEAFDKIAKMLDLTYPGGPNLESLSLQSNNNNLFQFKPCLINSKTLNFSFSGLKTQVLYKIQELRKIHNELSLETKANIAFAAQKAIIETLISKLKLGIKVFNNCYGNNLQNDCLNKKLNFVVCGGVSANNKLKAELNKLCIENNLKFNSPSLKYATDNATMIAFTGLEYFKRKLFSSLSLKPETKCRFRNFI